MNHRLRSGYILCRCGCLTLPTGSKGVPPLAFREASGISTFLYASRSSDKVLVPPLFHVRAFASCAEAHMPSADFCLFILPPHGGNSTQADRQISPGIAHALSSRVPVASTSTPSG